jgi:hypothetical protein
MSLFQIGSQTLTDSHVKLDILVDTQKPLSTSHHRIAFEYDEDTVSIGRSNSLHIRHINIRQLQFLCWEHISF